MSGGSLEPEIEAMVAVAALLEPLSDDERTRIMRWASAKYAVAADPGAARRSGVRTGVLASVDGVGEELGETPQYEHFAELFDQADPQTQVDQALVAAYWCQVVRSAPSFQSAELNRELKDLGRQQSSINKSLQVVMDRRPSLVIQIKKSGNTQQARKTYKLTDPGIRTVEAMIAGGAADE